MTDFDKKVNELFQLCRKVQKKTDAIVVFNIGRYKTGNNMSISIREESNKMYNIVEGGYLEEENTEKAKEHLSRLLTENLYCEVKKDGK